MPTPKPQPTTIDEYIAACPEGVRPLLERIRRTVRRVAPAATEAIAYRIPTFRLNGNLVHFAAFQKHIGFYPPVQGDAELVAAVARYANPRGNLQFPLAEPVPFKLIERIVRLRVRQSQERQSQKKNGR